MEVLDNLLGLHTKDLAAYQMVSRAVIIFFTSLIFIRVAGLRTLGKQSTFDALTLLMLGSILGRSIVVSQSFFGSVLSALIIMVLHRMVAWITFNNKKAGELIKGNSILLIKNGEKEMHNLRRTNITENDIMESLRKEVHLSDLGKIKEAHRERSGDISIVKEEI